MEMDFQTKVIIVTITYLTCNIPPSGDPDDDGDGTLDGDEDDDGDGVVNKKDADDDNDGVLDENDEL